MSQYVVCDGDGTINWKCGNYIFRKSHTESKKISVVLEGLAPSFADAMNEHNSKVEYQKQSEKLSEKAHKMASEIIAERGYPEECEFFLSQNLIDYFLAEYSDSLRIARADNPQELKEYRDTISCCGCVDIARPFFLRDGSIVVILFGYNYGH